MHLRYDSKLYFSKKGNAFNVSLLKINRGSKAVTDTKHITKRIFLMWKKRCSRKDKGKT